MSLNSHNSVESDGKFGSWIPEPWLSTITFSYFSSGLKTSQAWLFLNKGTSLLCLASRPGSPTQAPALFPPQFPAP